MWSLPRLHPRVAAFVGCVCGLMVGFALVLVPDKGAWLPTTEAQVAACRTHRLIGAGDIDAGSNTADGGAIFGRAGGEQVPIVKCDLTDITAVIEAAVAASGARIINATLHAQKSAAVSADAGGSATRPAAGAPATVGSVQRLPRRTSLFDEIALTVISTVRNGIEYIPSHRIVATDFYGACSFADCTYLEKADADKHVVDALLTSLVGKCDPASQAPQSEWPLAIDLGSNIGQFASFLRAMQCRVKTVEPQVPLNRFFRGTLDVNKWADDGSVLVHEGAVGEEPGELKLTHLWVPGGVKANRWKQEFVAPVIPLRSIITEDVAFLKLDIDGPEAIVFRALLPILKRHSVDNIMAEITYLRWPWDFNVTYDAGAETLDKYYDLGYSVYLTYENEFKIYPPETLSKLQGLRHFHFFDHCYFIPRPHLKEVLMMANKSTKNLYFSRTVHPPPSTSIVTAQADKHTGRALTPDSEVPTAADSTAGRGGVSGQS
eukprot:Opistho-2@58861